MSFEPNFPISTLNSLFHQCIRRIDSNSVLYVNK